MNIAKTPKLKKKKKQNYNCYERMVRLQLAFDFSVEKKNVNQAFTS